MRVCGRQGMVVRGEKEAAVVRKGSAEKPCSARRNCPSKCLPSMCRKGLWYAPAAQAHEVKNIHENGLVGGGYG